MRPLRFCGMQRLAMHPAPTQRLPARQPRSSATTASLFLQGVGQRPAVEEDFADIGSRCRFAVHRRSALLLGTAPGPLAAGAASARRGRNRTNSNCNCGCQLPPELSESQAELQRNHARNKNGKPLVEYHLLEPMNPDSSRTATAALR